MRAYVITTGVVFGLITLAHILRMTVEPNMMREPWFLLTTAVSAGLSVLAFVLARRRSPSA